MSYTVLARKYRSKTFDDLVGQEAIATTLKNAVSSGRVHHGYLFTGTRGVGKTSCARVLAKALNCMASDAPTPAPCCACESCRMIAEGEDLDVLEIDAASHTGVDNIRDLRDNSAYRPARARFKVYIIDEVHMLSTPAFNALLKTLEEPPDHVKFILATTEIQKVPATIVSRCQRFDFRSISIDAIAGHLKTVLDAENVKGGDDAVIRRIARQANGSMRDALSLMDQLLSFGGGRLDPRVVDDILPVMHDEVVSALMDHVADQDAAAALGCVERSLSSGQTIERFCELMVEHLRTLMLFCVCGAKTDLVDLPEPVRERLSRQSERFDPPTYVYLLSLMEDVRRAVKSSSASRALIDAAVVRMAMADNFSNIETLLEQLDDPTPPAAEANAAKKKAERPHRPSADVKPAPAATPKTRAPARDEAAISGVGAPRASPVSTTSAGASSTDEARVRADAGVQRAMDLFDGTLMSVHRSTPKTTETHVSAADREAGAETANAERAAGAD